MRWIDRSLDRLRADVAYRTDSDHDDKVRRDFFFSCSTLFFAAIIRWIGLDPFSGPAEEAYYHISIRSFSPTQSNNLLSYHRHRFSLFCARAKQTSRTVGYWGKESLIKFRFRTRDLLSFHAARLCAINEWDIRSWGLQEKPHYRQLLLHDGEIKVCAWWTLAYRCRALGQSYFVISLLWLIWR